MLAQGVDGINDKGNDDVNAIGFMLGYAGLDEERWRKHIKHNLSFKHTHTHSRTLLLSAVYCCMYPSMLA